jgi:L-alanine-DL-glutamate epimerase-like enolase superfamily enzyme
MALWDICGQDCGQPLYNLLGGQRWRFVDCYRFVRARSADQAAVECSDALARGFGVFYLKVGVEPDVERELGIVEAIRAAVGPRAKIRIDANCRWTLNEGLRNLLAFDRFGLDFAEAPVPFEPLRNMVEVRARTPVAICANEGLGMVGSVWECTRARLRRALLQPLLRRHGRRLPPPGPRRAPRGHPRLQAHPQRDGHPPRRPPTTSC